MHYLLPIKRGGVAQGGLDAYRLVLRGAKPNK
jgi:hypothetical protein